MSATRPTKANASDQSAKLPDVLTLGVAAGDHSEVNVSGDAGQIIRGAVAALEHVSGSLFTEGRAHQADILSARGRASTVNVNSSAREQKTPAIAADSDSHEAAHAPLPANYRSMFSAQAPHSTVNAHLHLHIGSNPAPLPHAPVPLPSSDIKDQLPKSLKDYYRTKSKLKTPLLQQEQPITEINLSIVETKQRFEQKQTVEKDKKNEKDEKHFSKEQEHFEKMYRVTVEEMIKPGDIFKNRHGKTPGKIVILGRPGIGKTTMSQYFAYQWAQGKLWNTQFDYVFWIPLRNLVQEDSKATTLAEAVLQECFKKYDQRKFKALEIEELLIQEEAKGQHGRVLLVLDGYDEVSQLPKSSHASKIVEEALTFPKVILTSRPYHTQQLPTFDSHLENMGFTNDNIKNYVNDFFKNIDQKQSKPATQLLSFLESNPSVWGSAHMPINLALICDIWQSQTEEERKQWLYKTTESKKEGDSVHMSMTSLYQTMMRYLLKHALKGKDTNAVSDEKLYEWCNTEIKYLERLAFEGLQQQEGSSIYLSGKLQQSVLKTIDEKNSEAVFKKALVLGMLHTLDKGKQDEIQKDRHFIHLTFQEFFAARYVKKHLKKLKENNESKESKAATRTEGHTEEQNRIREFIIKEKYTPRYQVLWGFVSGLLSAEQSIEKEKGLIEQERLEAYWELILGAPRDLTGINHYRLVIHCKDAPFIQKYNASRYS